MHSLLQDSRKGNIAVAIGIGIDFISRRMVNMAGKSHPDRESLNNAIDGFVNDVNDVHIIDVDLAISVVNKMVEHRQRVFTYSADYGLILLEDIVTEEMDDACEDMAELIGSTRALIATIPL